MAYGLHISICDLKIKSFECKQIIVLMNSGDCVEWAYDKWSNDTKGASDLRIQI